MKFNFDLLQVGLSLIEFETESKKISYMPGHITDVFGDLLRVLVSIIPVTEPQGFPETKSEFLLELEPAVVKIQFVNNDPFINIVIFEYDDSVSDSNKKNVFNEFVELKGFIAQVLESGKKILNKYGFIGYKENCIDHEFPVSSFLYLYSYLSHEISQSSSPDVHYQKMISSLFSEEIAVLQSFIP